MLFQPLKKEDIISVIEGNGAASRIPTFIHFWTHPSDFELQKQPEVLNILNNYPQDVQSITFNIPKIYDAPCDDPNYRWVNFDNHNIDENKGLDENIAISDWSQLDDILKDFPDPNYKQLFNINPEPDGRYRLGTWRYCLFERHWSLRGMTNALMDFYLEPDNVHRLYRALTDFYLVVLERAKIELNIDGLFVSDDLGTQTGPFFSLEIFNEFFKPYYKELIDKAHSLGMHFWLHTCGNIENMLPEFIEIGLDVIHPIQKYTMDEQKIAQKYGNDICIWAGFDVQQIIPWGTPEEVRKEVRFMIDTYYRPEGRLMLTAGNGINGDCPIESLQALFDESFKYGLKL